MRRLVPALSLLLIPAAAAMAADPVVIVPPVDVSGYITSGITVIGAICAVAIGGWFGFKVVKKALAWAGRALG